MSPDTVIALFIIALFVGALIVLALWFFREASRQECKAADLEAQIAGQAARIAELEKQKGGKAHTYATAAGLEDATAVLLELLQRKQAEDAYTAARLEQVYKITGIIRQGPYAYDPDRPAGPRPKVQQ